MEWIEKQKNIIDFTLSSLLRRKGKNLALVVVYSVIFTASETFDVGIDLGSPVAAAYEARRPFEFNGTIHTVKVLKTGK